LPLKNTSDREYTSRLEQLQTRRWKTVLDVQRPYRWNLKRLKPGRTLDVGCGVGRCLRNLPPRSIGIDPNEHSIEIVNCLGMAGYTPAEFEKSDQNLMGTFDSILFAHVLEHLTMQDGLKLIQKYIPLLRSRGQVIAFCPQEKGFKTDPTHVTFLDFSALNKMFVAAGLKIERSYSFPFPRFLGVCFPYNEFVVVGRKVQSAITSR
jgi:2-polyprenyl-3-methyl-5-hydroxy-6-metoxy-1,4-benzoquinol methylase